MNRNIYSNIVSGGGKLQAMYSDYYWEIGQERYFNFKEYYVIVGGDGLDVYLICGQIFKYGVQ